MIQRIADRLEEQIKENLFELELLDQKRAEKVKSSKEYAEYIRSKEWQETRQRIFRRDHFNCAICGASKNLRVHHITYENLGEEKDSDLITLCDSCHAGVHESEWRFPFALLKAAENIFSAWINGSSEVLQEYGEVACPHLEALRQDFKAVVERHKEEN